MSRNGLEASVAVRLADGLAAIEPQDRITVVSLCGMGGDTMCAILQAGPQRLAGVTRLVLQPNGGEREHASGWPAMATGSSTRNCCGKTASTTRSSLPSRAGRCTPLNSCTSGRC